MFVNKFHSIVVMSGVVLVMLLLTNNICQGQTAADLTQLLQNLSPQMQQDLMDLAGGQLSEQQNAQAQQPLPQPRQSIRITQEIVHKKVSGARSGKPNYGTDGEIVIPEDKSDFWDRVKRVFVGALMEAFNNISNLQTTAQPAGPGETS